jgi:hypothetical protein
VVDARVRKRAREDPIQTAAVGHPRQLTSWTPTRAGSACARPVTVVPAGCHLVIEDRMRADLVELAVGTAATARLTAKQVVFHADRGTWYM